MQLDTERWTRLTQEIRALKAQSQGLSNAIFQMERTRDQAMAALAQVRNDVARSGRPTQEIGAAMDRTLAEAEGNVDRVAEELAGLQRQHDALFRRSNSLRSIERACRDWARANGITLDAEDAKPPVVSFQPSSPGRQFGYGAPGNAPGLAGAGPEAASPAEPLGRGRSARSIFSLLSRGDAA